MNYKNWLYQCSIKLFLSWRAAVGMPKKFQGENSKAATARARKAEAKAVADACKKQQEEDALWQETDKHVLKKEQRKVNCLFSAVSCWNVVWLQNVAVFMKRPCCDTTLATWIMCVLLFKVILTNVCKRKTKMLAELSYLSRKKVRITVLSYWFGEEPCMWPLICLKALWKYLSPVWYLGEV